jgi:hypothetical protein
MLAAYLRPALPSSLPVLYLMAPMPLYGSPVMEAAREYPFATLAGYPVKLWVAEDMYRSNPEWAALWPLVRRHADCAVFLDRNGWVARGVRVEAEGLLAAGKRVWWFHDGEPTEWFGFGPVRADFKYRYSRVGLGYRRPVRSTRDHPLDTGAVSWPSPRRRTWPSSSRSRREPVSALRLPLPPWPGT